MNLFLFPGSRNNLGVSVYQSVNYSMLEQNLPWGLVNRIKQNFQGQRIHCWAFGSGGQSGYDKIDEDDVMLFKEEGNDSFCIKGEYADKVKTAQLGQALWGAPWEFIFFIKNISETSIPLSRLRNALDYDDKFWLPGALRVSDDKLNNLIKEYGTFEKAMSYLEAGKKPTVKSTILRKASEGNLPHKPNPIINDSIEDQWKI